MTQTAKGIFPQIRLLPLMYVGDSSPSRIITVMIGKSSSSQESKMGFISAGAKEELTAVRPARWMNVSTILATS